MNTYEYFFSLFSFLAVVLGILFFLRKKGDAYANRILGAYVLLFGYNVFYNVLYWTNKLFTPDYFGLFLTNMLIWVLYGPILYLYVRRIIHGTKIKWKDSIHFIPFLLIFINHIKVYTMPVEAKLDLFQSKMGILPAILFFSPHTVKVVIGLMFFYFALIMISIRKGTASRTKSIWLRWMAFSYLGYIFSFLSFFVVEAFGVVGTNQDYIIGASMIFFISMLAYFGFVQPDIFDGLSIRKVVPVIKYKSTGLTKDFSLELKHELKKIMQEEKPFLNSEYRLDDLAKQLNISRHHCSQVINEHFDSNFFNFLNRYRVEEFKRLITSDKSMNIPDAMFASGFNNRVSFYSAFKKFTGTTPKRYLEEYNEQPA